MLGSNPTAPLKIAARSFALIVVIAQLLAGPALRGPGLTSDLRATVPEASTAKAQRSRTVAPSLPLDHDLQVLAREREHAIGRPVALRQQREQVAGERRLLFRVERGEGPVEGAIVGAEDLDPVER